MASRLEWIGGAKVSEAAIGRKDLFVISHLAFSIFHLSPVRRFEDRIGQTTLA
jgi:hypothetical protein